jgi:hypothetical protein
MEPKGFDDVTSALPEVTFSAGFHFNFTVRWVVGSLGGRWVGPLPPILARMLLGHWCQYQEKDKPMRYAYFLLATQRQYCEDSILCHPCSKDYTKDYGDLADWCSSMKRYCSF